MKNVLFVLFTLAALVPLACAQVYVHPLDRGVPFYPGGNRFVDVAATAALGGGIGYLVGGRNAALIGAGGGAVAAGLLTRDWNPSGGKPPKPVDCTRRQKGEKAAFCAAEAEGAEFANRALSGGRVKNASLRWLLVVTDCGGKVPVVVVSRVGGYQKFDGGLILNPGVSAQVIGSKCGGFKGTMLVRSASSAGVVEEQIPAAMLTDKADGWVFYLKGGAQ